MNAAIEIDTLTKNFGAVRALDGLNLRVERGEVHGFLGPNGAGKSTTIRILLGLVRADSGTVNRSGLGGSPCSGEDTPVCSVIGASTTPDTTRSVTTSSVNGLAALGISALPSRRPNAVR